MFNKNNALFTRFTTYSVFGYVIVLAILHTILYFLYRDTILLSTLITMAWIQMILTALLVGAIVFIYKGTMKSQYIPEDETKANIKEIFSTFSCSDSSFQIVRENQKYRDNDNSGSMYRLIIDQLDHFHSNNQKDNEKLKTYETLYKRLRSDMQSISGKSKQLTDNSQKFYQNAHSQSSELESVSRAMDQFASQISDIADHTNAANRFAVETLEVTENGVEQMNDLISAITAISDSSRKILDMIKTIDQIASQTKLLALNATIEANRAGEHGKAFSVVAQEVKDLSAHSTEAAKVTSGLVDDAMRNLSQGNEISSKTVKTLTRTEEEVHKVSKIIEEIAESSTLQAEGVNRFNESLKAINQLVRQQRNVAKDATSVSQELSRYVEHLTENLDQFQAQDKLRKYQTGMAKKSRTASKPAGRPLKFICDQDATPLTYEENGRIKGILIDITKELFEKRMGIDVEYQAMEWGLCQEKMKQGLGDAIFTVTTDERLSFCDTHINSGFTIEWVIWTYVDHPRLDEIKKIRSLEDIINSDFTVGTFNGAGWITMMLEDKGAKVKYFDNEFEKLGLKKIDLIVEEPLMGKYKISICKIPEDRFLKIDIVLQTASLQYLIYKDSPYIYVLPEIDHHLITMKQDGTMKKILLKY